MSSPMMVNDPEEIEIEDALIIGSVPSPVHSTRQEPEKDSELTSLSVRPDPITGPFEECADSITEFRIITLPIVELPPSVHCPVPIPRPELELLRSTCELEIIRTAIAELAPNSSPFPVPIPAPDAERAPTIVEFQIVRLSIFEVPY
jgi:hypothetical protein